MTDRFTDGEGDEREHASIGSSPRLRRLDPGLRGSGASGSGRPAVTTFLRTYAEPTADLQRPAAVGVVIPTVLRPSLIVAVDSIFRQNFAATIQVLIGIDAPLGDFSVIDRVCQSRPPHCHVQVFYPGYSTSVRHGGLHVARDGGVLRCVLSYLANSRHIAYLDDDNWWREDHLALMMAAVAKGDWAYALRWFVHPDSLRPVCLDRWESVGPNRGVYKERFGGFVDPNCLILDKLACEKALPWWNTPLPGDPTGATMDRQVFAALSREFRGVGTGQPTVYYRMNPTDILHPQRLRMMGTAYAAASAPPW